jgi:hypothetical protein
MRFRLGLLIGLGTGYYYGAKAGRDRYEQLNQMLEKAKQTEAYETATEKAKAVVDLTVERARDLVEDHRPAGEGIDDTTVAVDADHTAVGRF